MRRFGLLIILASFAVIQGCGRGGVTVTGSNGEKVTSDARGNVSVTDNKGNTTDVQANNGNLDMKSSTGAEMHVDEKGVTGKTDKGEEYSMGASTVSEAELGLPFYPGSQAAEKSDVKVDTEKEKTFVSVRTTADTPDKVTEFYKSKLKETAVTTMNDMSSLTGKMDGGKTVGVMAQVVDGKTRIQVSVQTQK